MQASKAIVQSGICETRNRTVYKNGSARAGALRRRRYRENANNKINTK